MARLQFSAVVVLALASSLAAAAETTVSDSYYEDNLLDTIHYQLPQHQWSATAAATTHLNDASMTTQQGGVGTYGYTRTSWSSAVTASYGITDQLTVGIGETYLFGEGTTRTQESTGNVVGYSAKGFSDPTLSVSYRYWGGQTGTHFGNAYINVTPALGTRQLDSTAQIGNDLNASSEIAIGTNLIWVAKNQEFALEPHLQYYTSGSASDATAANSYNINSYNYLAMDAAWRFHFLKNYFVEGVIDFIGPINWSQIYSNRVTPLSISYTTPFYMEPQLVAGWKVKDNFLMVLNFTYVSDQTNFTQSTGGQFTSQELRDDVTLTAHYLF